MASGAGAERRATMATSLVGSRSQDPVSQSTLENRADEALVAWLTEEHPQPGQTVPIREFARKLGMSRTPVRSAVGRLHERGLLSYDRSEEHTSELQSRFDLVCRLLLEKKNRRKDRPLRAQRRRRTRRGSRTA